MQLTQVNYQKANLKDLQVVQSEIITASGRQKTLTHVELDGQKFTPTDRFWNSVFSRFSISSTIFNYFSHAEVFQRIDENKDADVRLAVTEDGELLAATNPTKQVIKPEEAWEILKKHQAEDIHYRDGYAVAMVKPQNNQQFKINGDGFEYRFLVEIPIDGYGNPQTYISLLRLKCTNGMVGYSKSFKQAINIGKEPVDAVKRSLANFDNDEGYVSLRNKVELAQNSFASVNECQKFGEVLRSQSASIETQAKFYDLAGRMNEFYGLANFKALSSKKLSMLPSKAKVYDLMNFASEIATHHCDKTPRAKNAYNAYIGGLISKDYDLEGTADNDKSEFDDFLIDKNTKRKAIA